MKTVRLLLLCCAMILTADSCKKDNREWLLPITAHDFLSSSKYESLRIDIVYVEGYQPSETSVNNLKAFLDKRLNKPQGITVTYKSIAPTGKSAYSIEDLREIEKNNRSEYSKHKNLVAFVFFADAQYSDADVLGVAYGNSSVAIFQKQIQNNSGGIGQPLETILESTVEQHEFGHLMGLVDNGTKMVNSHSANGKHCNNENCLMYYAVETTNIMANIMGGSVPDLDDNCIADLRKNGGR